MMKINQTEFERSEESNLGQIKLGPKNMMKIKQR